MNILSCFGINALTKESTAEHTQYREDRPLAVRSVPAKLSEVPFRAAPLNFTQVGGDGNKHRYMPKECLLYAKIRVVTRSFRLRPYRLGRGLCFLYVYI